MIGFDEFKELMRGLSIKTGKVPTAWGKAPAQGKLNYVLSVYHDELKQHDYDDIKRAFADKSLMMEISTNYSLSVGVIEKCIQSYKNQRVSREKEVEVGKWEEPSKKTIKDLKEMTGIDISKIVGDKTINTGRRASGAKSGE